MFLARERGLPEAEVVVFGFKLEDRNPSWMNTARRFHSETEVFENVVLNPAFGGLSEMFRETSALW